MEERPVPGSEWRARAGSLAAEGWWLADLCGLDRLGLGGEPRFHVVVQLLHHGRRERRTVHVEAPGDPPAVGSVAEVWPAATNMEREVFDLFGIRFEGHPDLTRIMLPDEWEGHPLRKDYGVGKVPVEFIPQPVLQLDAPGQSPQGPEAERGVDALGQAGPPERDLSGSEGASAPRGARA
ncbi:MAG TPA: NADH-quinone oxidoreductase subunit C [Actinomycetota bacterium]|jgi:NADH-quinone oxidoreductase subunit C|nr:NADH-quinone oxidoreductase subunit C [Actinomycetota bacterium]